MNVKTFKIWMAGNELKQKDLAIILGISEQTICKYVKNNKFPKVFEYALEGLESLREKQTTEVANSDN